MNFQQFIQEAPRAEPLIKTKDTKAKQEFRAPGDLGAVDRYTELDKNKPKNTIRRRAGAKNTLRKTRRDYSQADQLVDRTAKQKGEDPVAPTDDERRFTGSDSKKGSAPKRITARFRPSNERLKKADDDNIEMVRDAQSGIAGEPIEVEGMDEPVPRFAGLRHNQPAGVGLSKTLTGEDIEYLIGATADTNPQRKEKNKKFRNPDAPQPQDKAGIEDTKQRRQTGRDIEALDSEAEAEAAKTKAYLQDPKVRKYQQKLRDATDNQDAKALQKLVFKHKVTPEMVEKYKEAYGMTSDNRNARFSISDRISGAGSTAPMSARYGGDLGKEAKRFEVAPGVYNWSKLPASLKKKAQENRENAMIETYLKQGGRDAYAAHEGVRAITDLDLEHITSLKGEGNGLDHPDNWVFASAQSNRQRGERNLTGPGSAVEKLAQGTGGGGGLDKDVMKDAKSTYTEIVDRMRVNGQDEEADAIEELTGGKRGFTLGNYKKFSDNDRSKIRKALEKGGASAEEALKAIPKAKIGDFKFDSDEKGGESYLANPEQFGRDTEIDDADRMTHNSALDMIGELPQYAEMDRESLKDTKEYKDVSKALQKKQSTMIDDDL